MIYHLPLESYRERYTAQLRDWYHRRWKEHAVDYRVIEGTGSTGVIKTGSVLDAYGRSKWAMSQIWHLLDVMEKDLDKGSKDQDVILLDDFWHPGIECFKYASELNPQSRKFKIYAYCWAQSVDVYDFTNRMSPWIRHFEKGIGQILDGIFVASSMLRELLYQAGIAPYRKIHVVGLPFDSNQVLEMCPIPNPDKRENRVVWSSRWDEEKCPEFFVYVMEQVLKVRKDVKFTICTSAPKLRSNNEYLLKLLEDTIKMFPNNIELRENLTKEEYYQILRSSKIQFNCADQDWVSFTLLEATALGCYPIYPNFRSFPESLKCNMDYMYSKGNIQEAAAKINKVLNTDEHWGVDKCVAEEVYKTHDLTWLRILNCMNIFPNRVSKTSVDLWPVYQSH